MTRCSNDEKNGVEKINSMSSTWLLSICPFDSASVATRGRLSSMLFVYSKTMKLFYIITRRKKTREREKKKRKRERYTRKYTKRSLIS